MKKFFALLLVVLMLLPSILACGKDVDETTPTTTPAPTTTTTTPAPTGSSNGGGTNNSSTKPSGSTPGNSDIPGSSTEPSTTPSSTPGIDDPNPNPEPAPEPIKKWSGSTLKILATTWGGNLSVAGAPWSQVELTVDTEADEIPTTNFGGTINRAVVRRAQYIKDECGVALDWVNARNNQIATLLSESVVGGSTKYHIAMPRMLEAQTIVSNNTVFNLADREYIDLDKSYYNQVARESYSIRGVTLFAAGDFSFLDEQTSYLTYYNEAMTEGMTSFSDLYQMVKKGEWTLDVMKGMALLVKKDTGETGWTDEDTYGFGTTNMSRYFQYSGIQQVVIREDKYGPKYVIGLDDTRVTALLDQIISITNSEWARTNWTGGYGAMEKAFTDGRLLFYDEVVQKLDNFPTQTEDFKVAVLPTPKLSDSQDRYYTPCTYQAVLMCIPKSTPDREMSDYFFEMLSYTGQVYIMDAYKLNMRSKLNPDTMTESMDIIENFVFPNLCYDQGYMYGWDGLLSDVQGESYSEGKNNFAAAYGAVSEEKGKIVSQWNTAWLNYSDAIE